MTTTAPRVAFFTDSFHEVNGVALTSRQLEAYARRNGFPFFSVHAGPQTRTWQEEAIVRYELAQGRTTFALESDLRFDLGFLRHREPVLRALKAFAPDLVHITGPSHLGILGAILARQCNVPLVASWHTNIHEFGGRRLAQLLDFLPESWSHGAGQGAESASLAAAVRFYRMAKVLLAPNQGLIDMLENRTGRKCFLMQRGVDTGHFHPSKRQRADDAIVIGYIGRTSPEKNVQYLAEIERAVRETGFRDYRIFVAGHGGQLEWLRENLKQSEIPGVLKGDDLARAYANLDIFAFPSETDTFGNVVQEAMASGVPCVVTDKGGPAYIVHDGVDGYVAPIGPRFTEAVLRLTLDNALRRRLAEAARETALKASWDRVFANVYRAYQYALDRTQPLES